MQIERSHSPRGRRRTWKAGLSERLVRDVENLRAQNKKLTIIGAVKYLKKHSPDWETYSVKNLCARYPEAVRAILRKQRTSISVSKYITRLFTESPDYKKFGSMTIANLRN